MSEFFTFDLVAAAVISGFFLGIAPAVFALFVLTQPGDLLPKTVWELIARYVYGTTSLLIGFSVLPDSERTMDRILFITVVGGFVVVLRYFSDHYQGLAKRNRMSVNNDKDLNNGQGR